LPRPRAPAALLYGIPINMQRGCFIKTPSGHATEIFGDLGYDFVVIDEEHAPFDRLAIDQALVSARAAQIAALVRVASPSASNILSVLDGGAIGVLVPHVSSAQQATEIAAACRYRGGKRGFSNSPRAGRYGGLSLHQHVEHAVVWEGRSREAPPYPDLWHSNGGAVRVSFYFRN